MEKIYYKDCLLVARYGRDNTIPFTFIDTSIHYLDRSVFKVGYKGMVVKAITYPLNSSYNNKWYIQENPTKPLTEASLLTPVEEAPSYLTEYIKITQTELIIEFYKLLEVTKKENIKAKLEKENKKFQYILNNWKTFLGEI